MITSPARVSLRTLCAIAVAITLVRCDGGGSPTGPRPTPTPSQPTLTFIPETDSPIDRSLAIGLSSRGQEPDKISIAVRAVNLVDLVKVRGNVKWDPRLFDFEGWGRGEFFESGGALVNWTLYNNTPGEIELFLDRPDTLPGATGSGEIILLRFQLKAGITSGSTSIQWDAPEVFGAGYHQIAFARSYGGTIVIQ